MESKSNKPSIERLCSFNPHTLQNKDVLQINSCARGSIIYFLYLKLSSSAFPIYVGKSIRGIARIEEHKFFGDCPYDFFLHMNVPEEYLSEVERYYIKTFYPIMNMQNNPFYYSRATRDMIVEDIKHIQCGGKIEDAQCLRLSLNEDNIPMLRIATPMHTTCFERDCI